LSDYLYLAVFTCIRPVFTCTTPVRDLFKGCIRAVQRLYEPPLLGKEQSGEKATVAGSHAVRFLNNLSCPKNRWETVGVFAWDLFTKLKLGIHEHPSEDSGECFLAW
jgi:hypothetical protein